MATIPLLDTVMPKFEKKHGGVYPVGLSFGFSRDGFIQTYPIPSKEKNHQLPVPYKSIKVDTTGFFREKLHFQTQTIGESKSLMINQLILIIPRKTSLYFP